MSDDKKFSTEKLDVAMKELIDICQQYNDKILQHTNRNESGPNRAEPAQPLPALPQPPPPLSNSEIDSTRINSNFSVQNGHRDFPRLNRLFDSPCKGDRNKRTANATQCDNNMVLRKDTNEARLLDKSSPDSERVRNRVAQPQMEDGSIDRLQLKQCELQRQLDEVLEVARNLDLKQKRRIGSLIEESTTSPISTGAARLNDYDEQEEEEDIELIEFRQIENELRISELNRQLANIQEQLRLRLYRRLSSRTSSESFKSAREHRRTPPMTSTDNKESLKRRDSAQTDESTPSTSSCSDEPTASSSISKNSIDNDLANQLERCNLAKEVEAFAQQQRHQSQLKIINERQGDHVDASPLSALEPKSAPELGGLPSLAEAEDEENEDLELAFDQRHNYEVLVPTSSLNNKQAASNNKANLSSHMSTCNNNIYTNVADGIGKHSHLTNGIGHEPGQNYHNAFNGLRVCPVSNDLERIEEDEEDDNECYCSSDQFRKVYETKISPIMHAAANAESVGHDGGSDAPSNQRHQQVSSLGHFDAPSKPRDAHIGIKESNPNGESAYTTPRLVKDRRFDPDNINSARRGGNRPLTIYLPRPDEEIDLIETVQALGHDLDILSTHIQFTPSTARGYLYKLCSNNSKKWLKRYFYFDRQSKNLSYYENEEQLVKKTNSPKSTIPFDEIGDVYVDHRLNELNEKQRGSKRKSYVFVLATSNRKYLLASAKPEAMRAWIDVLFTAAKANDYFQQVGDDPESLSFNYNSFTCE